METIVLDPAEVAISRTAFDITPYIAEAGPDFGDADVEQYLADAQIGQIPVDSRLPNRTITIPLLLTARGLSLTFEQLRTRFQQKTGLFQRDGGWIKRQTPLGPLYADITKAQLKMGGSTAQALWGIDADAILTLTTLPDWYGDEIIETAVSNPSNATELSFVVNNVKGDIPARARLAVVNQSTIDIHGLMWGVRSRNYSTAGTAALAYEARFMTPISPAASAANAGAAGGFEVKLADDIPPNWTAILSTDLPAGGGALTHIGSYRVWARVRIVPDPANPTFVNPMRVRLAWDVGDLMNPVENSPVSLPLDTDWWLADLGEIRIAKAPIGTHRWQGVIQAYGSYDGLAVNKVWLQPLDEAAGRISVTPGANVGLVGYSARDGWNVDSTAVVVGTTLTTGGNWTFSHGDTDDFTFDGTNFRIKRGTTADTAARFIYASGPTMTMTAEQVDFFSPGMPGGAGTPGNVQSYLMFRRVDASNYGYASVGHFEDGVTPRMRLTIGAVVAGTNIPLGVTEIPYFEGAWWSLRVGVSTNGYIFVWLFPRGSTLPVDPTALRYDPTRFGTGGVLASGKVGIGDQYSGTYSMVRYYDNFLAWVPDNEAVIYNGKSAELRFDGMYRESPSGSAYTQVGTVLGDLFRVPASGLETRKVEVLLKPSFGDFEQGADSILLKLQAQLRYRPCYLFVPEG